MERARVFLCKSARLQIGSKCTASDGKITRLPMLTDSARIGENFPGRGNDVLCEEKHGPSGSRAPSTGERCAI